eukprot:gene25760-46872_t
MLELAEGLARFVDFGDRQMLSANVDKIESKGGLAARHYRMGKNVERGGRNR